MKQTSNLGLTLYDKSDLMNITGLNNSLNHNMELLDLEINQLSQNKADKNSIVNPDLLDNSDFENPVDQRGGYVVLPGLNM